MACMCRRSHQSQALSPFSSDCCAQSEASRPVHACRARREAVLKQAVEGAVADGEYKGMNNYIDYTAVRPAFPFAHSLLVLGLEVSSGARCSLQKHRGWMSSSAEFLTGHGNARRRVLNIKAPPMRAVMCTKSMQNSTGSRATGLTADCERRGSGGSTRWAPRRGRGRTGRCARARTCA